LFPGVLEWFDRINKYGEECGVKIEHYIISSGLKEIIEGSKIGKYFKQIPHSVDVFQLFDKTVQSLTELGIQSTALPDPVIQEQECQVKAHSFRCCNSLERGRVQAVELPYLTLYVITVYRMMELALGGAYEYTYSGFIGPEPNQPHRKYRNLAVSLRKEPVNLRSTAETLLF
jgi:hypothetical protein